MDEHTKITLHTAKMRVERIPEVYFVDVTFAVETQNLTQDAQAAAAQTAALNAAVAKYDIDPSHFMAHWTEMNQGETIETLNGQSV